MLCSIVINDIFKHKCKLCKILQKNNIDSNKAMQLSEEIMKGVKNKETKTKWMKFSNHFYDIKENSKLFKCW